MIGTEENKRVANYLASEMLRIGLDVDTQQTSVLSSSTIPLLGQVTNVMGKIRGTDNTKAILVLGHYDSQPYTTGAADDGIALASMLESAEILKNHFSLKNDIIFLFTDAEEVGLLGAIAFANQHPWIDEVGLVLNIEARGNRGTALSFEVSPNNGWIMKEFIRNAEYPYAGSMMYEVYKMMPNYTDFTIFKDKDLPGFNIAIVEGYENYHSPTDKPENLSLASLQHMGSYIMSITSHFGNISLHNTKANDLVYFNLLGSKMVFYPLNWNVAILFFILILFVLFIYLGFARRELSFLKILYSFLVCLAAFALALVAVLLINNLIKSLYPYYSVFYMSNSYNASYYFFAYKAITVAVSTLILYFMLRRFNVFNVMAAVFFLFIILTVAILLLIPTASYLTFVVLVPGLIIFNFILLFNLKPENRGLLYYTILFIGVTPFIFVLTPYIYLIFNIFGLNLPIAGAAMLMLLMLMLIPILEVSLAKFKLYIPIMAFAVSLLFLFTAHLHSDFTKDKPLQSNVMYASLNDEGKAFWISSFTRTDEWNKQFFSDAVVDSIPEFYPGRTKLYLKNDADFMAFAKPEINIISDSLSDDVRYLEFTIKTMIEAGGQEILIPKTYNIKDIWLQGHQVKDLSRYKAAKGDYVFRSFNQGFSGINIRISYQGNETLSFSVIEKRLGLPPFSYITPLPPNIVEGVGYESHITLIKNKLSI